VKIEVVNNQIEAALKQLKKQMLKDGLYQEMKRRAHYEKPSVTRKRSRLRPARRGVRPSSACSRTSRTRPPAGTLLIGPGWRAAWNALLHTP
jgi:ribosomal protein S21